MFVEGHICICSETIAHTTQTVAESEMMHVTHLIDLHGLLVAAQIKC